MKVKLICYSQPSKEFLDETSMETMNDLVGYCARVSNPSNQMNKETADKLIKYLMENSHFSPFEMVNVCLEIETTRDIARQILRHRSFSFQEFSQRYADPVKDLDFEYRDCRLQDLKNRQNSIEGADSDLQYAWYVAQRELIEKARETYKWAIDNGIAKEVARAVLPEGLTMSRMYMNGTLRSWIHYLQLRSANGTQKEHMEIAKACAKAITQIFPLTKELTTEA
jgi:thymidylate synthase (FAD)